MNFFSRIGQNLGFTRGPQDSMGNDWQPGADPMDAGDPYNPANMIAGTAGQKKRGWKQRVSQGLMTMQMMDRLAAPPDPMQGMGPAPRPGAIVRGLLG